MTCRWSCCRRSLLPNRCPAGFSSGDKNPDSFAAFPGRFLLFPAEIPPTAGAWGTRTHFGRKDRLRPTRLPVLQRKGKCRPSRRNLCPGRPAADPAPWQRLRRCAPLSRLAAVHRTLLPPAAPWLSARGNPPCSARYEAAPPAVQNNPAPCSQAKTLTRVHAGTTRPFLHRRYSSRPACRRRGRESRSRRPPSLPLPGGLPAPPRPAPHGSRAASPSDPFARGTGNSRPRPRPYSHRYDRGVFPLQKDSP